MTRFTGRGRSRWMLAAAVAALLALVAACGGGGGENNFGGTAAPQAKGRDGDFYRAPQVQQGPGVTLAADTAYTAYNNAAADANSLYNAYVLTQVIASATWVDADGTVLVNGDVMDGIDLVSTNPEVVRWRIKPGITWSDGQPWNCKDFYLAYLAGSGKIPGFTAASNNGYQDIGSAQCTNDLTFEATFAKPYADYRGLFGQGNLDLLPAHVLEQRTGVPDIRQINPQSPPDVLQRITQFWNTGWNGFDKSVMPASGPYQLDSWVQDQSVRLTRNPASKGNPGGPESITYRNIADATAEAQALQNGEIQAAAPQVDVNSANLLRGLAAQGIKFQATTGVTYEHLDMNFKNPIFADKAVRQAFAQCVNRQELVDKLIKGVQPDAAPLQSLIYLPNQQGSQDTYSQIATGNAQQSNQTLTQAGWVRGADGVYAKNGQRLQFRISHTNVPRRVQTVQLIQAQCQQAGMQVVDDTDPNFLDQRVSQGDYDVALFGWANDPYISSHQSIYATGGGQNWQGYSNPQVDALMNQAVSDLDPNGFRQKWQDVDRLIAADLPSIPLFVQPNMLGYSDRIDNAYFQPNFGPLYNANEWVVQGG
ncbi:ABC transporter family substrate-binding protein [Actinomycetospora termitidis]|uniref:ABC transporter family substrate-binding protein n=1 Tax=Actinomycetospora termitidis TaxID=3053470 RepID=A0ABT7M9M0_9PSEU|nr:ABC transporter family substrate-binding protein [Actinomycetospora sp. Odt1-22]MDL5157369.1 ABC transporter family substrate-binding protein [Actinomycetospora sp. Odt1-22]